MSLSATPQYADDREYVSVAETTRLTGLSRTTVYALIAAGRLQTIKVGKRRLIIRRAIANLGNSERGQ